MDPGVEFGRRLRHAIDWIMIVMGFVIVIRGDWTGLFLIVVGYLYYELED